MRKGGGIEFYNSRPLRADFLLWTFAYACMVSFLSVNLPAFDRPDTINPNYRDIRSSWCVSRDYGSYMKVHAHIEVMHGGTHRKPRLWIITTASALCSSRLGPATIEVPEHIGKEHSSHRRLHFRCMQTMRHADNASGRHASFRQCIMQITRHADNASYR
jgi:hypothetical protein